MQLFTRTARHTCALVYSRYYAWAYTITVLRQTVQDYTHAHDAEGTGLFYNYTGGQVYIYVYIHIEDTYMFQKINTG